MKLTYKLSSLLLVQLSTGVLFAQKENVQELKEISVSVERTNSFKDDSTFIVAKLPLRDLENPQVYNSIKRELIQEQNVTNLNDALKNATGIVRLWESTGRGGDGAEFYSMRGFAVQPTMANGLPSINNGTIDPANVESIDVIKGPSGTLFGSSVISYGGLINITTKKPLSKNGGSFNYTLGNFGLNRLALDLNHVFTEKSAMRLNTSFNNQNSFQDAGFKRSFYLAPSFSFKANDKLSFLINTDFNFSEGANAPMIFLSRNAPISFDKIDLFKLNYNKSYTSNDLVMKNQTFGIQGQAFYKINNKWTSQTAISSGVARTNGYYHYLYDMSDGESFFRYISKRNGETQTVDLQQNFIGDFKFGNMRNKMVVGVDYYQSDITNSSTGWVGNGIVNLKTKEDSGDLTQNGVNEALLGSFEGQSTATTRVASAYFSNVLYVLPSLSAMVSLRADNFLGKTTYEKTNEIESQIALSPKFGMVYQPIKDKLALFANYMNGFSNLAPVEVADLDGSNVRMQAFDPEHANQFEAGIKSDFWNNKISFTASYYNILVANKLMQDPENVNNTIQGAEVLSQGIELSLIANPLRGLNIVAGFSVNDAEVIADNPNSGYLGLRPEEAGPEQLINFYTSYVIPKSSLKGLGFGFGGNVASEQFALNRKVSGSFILPAYQIFNASLFYRQKNYELSLRVNNLMNTKYFSGWSTVTAQQLRTISLKFGYNF